MHADRAAIARWQARIGAELLERLQFFRLEARVIVDLGCGAGAGAAALRARYPRSRVIAIDIALDMVRQARHRQRFWRRFDCLCADGRALPLAAQSADLVYSNLMLQHCGDPPALFAEVQRVLRPGGLLLFSSFGPDTLRELRGAWTLAGGRDPVSDFADMPQLAAAMAQAGLAEPVMDREFETAHYADARALVPELQRTSVGPELTRAMLAAYETLRTGAGLPASWEIIYGAAFAGQRATDAAGRGALAGARETSVALSAIGARRKNP